MGFFDKIFGKKKKEEQKPQPQVQPQQAQLPKQPAQKQVQQNQQKQVQKKEEVQKYKEYFQVQDEGWMYELVLQYLVSPIWKVTISQFLDEYCIVFDDEEENKFAYYDLHKKFKKMMEDLVDGMMAEIEIEEEQFGEVVERGLKSKSHRKYFEQLLVIDNFLVFKKMMIKRNRENELEALKEIQKQDNQRKGIAQQPNNDIIRLEQQKEKADLDHALELSKAVDQERRKLLQDEEDQFQQVLRQSELEYKQSVIIQKEEEDRMRQMQQQKHKPKDETPTPYAKVKAPEDEQVIVPDDQDEEQVMVFEEGYNQSPSLQQFYGVPASSQFVEEIPQSNQVLVKKHNKLVSIESNQSKLPPINEQRRDPFEKDASQAEVDRQTMQFQIDKIKQQQLEQENQPQAQQSESTDDRKKRLIEQRELLRKKKQAESQKELQDYQQQQSVKKSDNDMTEFIENQRSAGSELQRKRELLELKKKQLLMNKIKEEVNYEENLM